jgi:hypothetical protein
MNTLIVYMLCSTVQYMTLVTPEKVYLYPDVTASYIDIVKRGTNFKIVKADLANVIPGQCL